MKIQVFLVSKVSFEETCCTPDRGKKKREREREREEGMGGKWGAVLYFSSCPTVVVGNCGIVSVTPLYPTLPPQAAFSGDLGSYTEAD